VYIPRYEIIFNVESLQIGLKRGLSMIIRCSKFRAIVLFAALWAVVGIQVPAACAQGQDRAPEYYPADIQYGAQIFASQCTACHGTSGDLIPGVNFRAGVFKRRFPKAQRRVRHPDNVRHLQLGEQVGDLWTGKQGG